jgi:hypothetical protein
MKLPPASGHGRPWHRLSVGVVLAYAGLSFFTVMHHEPWLDEAQAWLIARDAGLLRLLTLTNYEGSPALWHLLLMPFAKAGLPYRCESLVHVIIATAAVAVFMLRAPLPRPTKVLFIFSYYIAYEYSILARSYSLGILLMFLVASVHEQRFRHPLRYGTLVLLLANANLFSLFVATGLMLRFLVETWYVARSRRGGTPVYGGLLIMGLGVALAVLQLFPAPDNMNRAPIIAVDPLHVVRAFRTALFPTAGDRRTYELVAGLIMAVSLLSILRRPGALFVLLWSYLGMAYVFAFRYPAAGQRHYGNLLAMLLFGLWLAYGERDRYWFGRKNRAARLYRQIDFSHLADTMIRFSLLIAAAFNLKIHYEDYRYPFSASKEIAKFVREHGLDRHTFVVHNSYSPVAVLPYLPHAQFWYAGIQAYGTYVVWTTRLGENFDTPVPEIMERVRRAFPTSCDLLFLLTEPLESPECYGLELLFAPDCSRWITRDHCALYCLAGSKARLLAAKKAVPPGGP